MSNNADSEERNSGLPQEFPESILKRADQIFASMQSDLHREGAAASFALSGDALGEIAYRHDPKLGEADLLQVDEWSGTRSR